MKQILLFRENLSLKDKKELFLRKLKSKSGKSKYKMYKGAPIRYAGGKSRAVGYIIELLPDNIERVVSPFIGGGSVEVAISKELGIPVIGYDIFDLLVNFWQVLLNKEKKYKMIEILESLKPNKETYEKVKQELKLHWEKKKIITDKIKLAAYYYFNHNLSYGPGFLGWPSSVYLNEKRYKSLLEKLRKFEDDNLIVKLGDFRETIPKHKYDFLYLDPPYYIGKDSKVFRGIYPMRNFPIHHHGFPHEVLRNLLREHKGGFILSYNDCPTIREWYKDCYQFFPKWQYSMGQGETRIGKYRKEREQETYVKESHEIIIFCPPKK